ncbi:MAG: thioesterase [Oscillospiraceae bacterium]|nr:thioesterase [Oscillospiraceae bacterium]
MEGFERKIIVPMPECDIKNRWKLSCIMRQMQEVGAQHLEALDMGFQKLWDEGFVFLLSKILLEIRRRPVGGERLRVVTQPRPPKGAQFLRDICFYDQNGEEIICAGTAWMLADPVSRTIRRPAEYPYVIPYAQEPYSDAAAKLKCRAPETLEPLGSREVRYSDLDTNGHVNNAVYGDIVCDHLPMEEIRRREIARFKIHYAREARSGDILELFGGALTADSRYQLGKRGEEKCFEAEVEYGPLGEEPASK